MLIRDGFPGQRLHVLARPVVREALRSPVTRRILVTDAGFFPHAAAHGRVRPAGAEQTIVIVCTSGRGRVLLEDTEHDVASGDAVIIPPHTPHTYLADEQDPWSIWWVHVTGEDMPELLPSLLGTSAVLQLHDAYRTTGLITRVVDALDTDDTTASLYEASGEAWRLLAHLCADRLRGRADPANRIRTVTAYLRDNLASRLSVAELAEMANLSTSHFSALFKTATGMSVIEYVTRLRSARARALLLATSAPVHEIASAVGYDDPYYFSRRFRAVNGVSPQEFRRRGIQEAVRT